MLYKEITLPFSSAFKKIPSVVFDIIFYCIVGFTFLGCINLFAKQGLLILISLVLSVVYVILKGKVLISITTLLVIAFAISYSIPAFVYYRDLFFTTLLYSFALVIYVQFFNCFENKKKFLIGLGIAYVAGLFVSFIFTAIMTFWTQGGAFGGEVANNFWTQGLISRTGVSLYQMGFIGGSFSLLLFKSKYRKWFTIPIFLFFIVFSTWFSLVIGNRSFLLAMAILLYAILIIKALLSKKWIKWFVLLIIYTFVVLGVLILVILVNKGVVTIPPELLKIPAINRLFTVNPMEGRPEIIQRFFSEFYKYPFGNYSLQINNGYVHNFLLDFYTFGGVFSFLLALAFFVFLIIFIVRFIRIKNVRVFEKAIIIGVIIGLIGIGLSEPIYQANPNCATFIFLAFLYMKDVCSKAKKIDKEYIIDGEPCIDYVEEGDMPLIVESNTTNNEAVECCPVDETCETIIKSSSKNKNAKAVCAVILITFNKPEALSNSFNNLLDVNFLKKKVDLIVSIDNSGDDSVENVAKSLKWPHGDLIIRTFSKRQGLKNHVLHCLEYADKYDAVFLLEDDIYYSESMFAYGYGAAKFYEDNPDIAGISLYNFQGNWQNWAFRFEPFNNGYDSYFVRLAQSWGEVITTNQWKNFKKWFDENKEFVKDDKNVPSINKWPDSSWLKFFDRYCFLNNKFFVYPYVSVVTNCNGVGIHNTKTINDFQTELQGSKTQYNFQPFDYSNPKMIYYDEYFYPLWINDCVDVSSDELTIDFFCTRPKNSYKKFVLTAGYFGKKFIKSWSLSLHPIELSIINNVQGEGIYLYESSLIKKKKPKLYNALNYSLRTSDWRRIKFYGLKLFFKTYFGLFKKRFFKLLKAKK